MKAIAPLLLALSITPLFAKTHKPLTLASEVFATAKPADTDHSPKAMVAAAESFLKTLTPEQRKQAVLPMNDAERRIWTNVPPKANVGGLRLGDLNKEQLEASIAFLSTVMSTEGYLKSRNIMLADDLLLRSKEQAERRGGFGAANFWVVIFGTPSETETWAVQLDGHHVANNITIAGEKMAISPAFIGTQPHRFMLGDKEIIPMQFETSLAFDFINSLDEKQRKEATTGKTRGRMAAGAGKDGVKPKQKGLSCKSLTADQRKILLKLAYLWLDDMPKRAADDRLKEIDAQLDQTTFAWHGPYKPGSDASYHLYGPGVIIEYNGQDLGGDPLDHLHSIYRDPTNEYGSKWAK
ncbi:MAG: DUF3500 domain-containing protein [Akkermansiaceae bacterium]|jgi:hypothetical protein|nr:DUF3500 domain-containing protein [Akkermansiaceae bacterium]